MSREIRSLTISDPANKIALPSNDFKDRLVKLIPSEIVTAYVTIFGLINAAAISQHTSNILQWAVFALLLTVTPFYLFYIAQVRKTAQIIFTSIAFIIWAIVIGSPFNLILDGPLTSLIGSILLIFYTLLIPFFYKG